MENSYLKDGSLSEAEAPIPVTYEIEREDKNGNLTTEEVSVIVPQKVADLNESQFIELAQFFFFPFRKDETQYAFLRQIMQLELKDFLAMGEETVMECLNLILPFLKTEPSSKNSLFKGFEKREYLFRKIRKFCYRKTKYEGPGNQLLSFVLDEFIMCEILFNIFLKNKNIDSLNQFCAVAYRPKGVSYEDYEKNEEKYVKLMAGVELQYKYAAVLNYMALRNFFTKKFWRVFGAQGGGSKVDNGWRATVVSLAGDKFGHPEKVRKTLLHDIMVHIDESEKSRKK